MPLKTWCAEKPLYVTWFTHYKFESEGLAVNELIPKARTSVSVVTVMGTPAPLIVSPTASSRSAGEPGIPLRGLCLLQDCTITNASSIPMPFKGNYSS